MSDSLFEDAEFESDASDIGLPSDELQADDVTDSPEADAVGKTSDELATDDAATAVADESDAAEKQKRSFSVFDAMLLMSLICVTLATIFLVMELRKFGNFPFAFPWRTSEALLFFGF